MCWKLIHIRTKSCQSQFIITRPLYGETAGFTAQIAREWFASSDVCFIVNLHYSDVIMSMAMMASQITPRLDCLLNCLFRHRSKKTSKLCVTGLCEGNPPVTSGFPSQRDSNTENASIWWCHHESFNTSSANDNFSDVTWHKFQWLLLINCLSL